MGCPTEFEQQKKLLNSSFNKEYDEEVSWLALAFGRLMRDSSLPSLTPEEKACPSDELLRQCVMEPSSLELSEKLKVIEHQFRCRECKQKVWRYYGEREWGNPEEGERLLKEEFDLTNNPIWRRVQEILDTEEALKEKMRCEGKMIFFFGQAHPLFHFMSSEDLEELDMAADATILRVPPPPTEEVFIDDAYSLQVVTRMYTSRWRQWLTVRIQQPDGTWMDQNFHVDFCRVMGEKVLEILMSKETTSDAYVEFDVDQLLSPSQEGEYCLVIYKEK